MRPVALLNKAVKVGVDSAEKRDGADVSSPLRNVALVKWRFLLVFYNVFPLFFSAAWLLLCVAEARGYNVALISLVKLP